MPEISIHEVRIIAFLRQNGWVTSKEVSEGARVAPRTARAHLLKLSGLGIVEQANVFPGHRYRFSAQASVKNKPYMDRLAKAAEAFE